MGGASWGSAGPAGGQIVTQIFKLNYESANNLVPVLRPLISPNNTVQANPGKATTSLTIASRGKGKGTGPVKFTISGGGDSVTTSASLTVKQVKKKKPKRNRR